MNYGMYFSLWTIIPILVLVILIVFVVIYAVKKRLQLEKKYNKENEKAFELMMKMKVPDQIKKLVELRDAGILSEEEFQTQKTVLLKTFYNGFQ